MTRSQWSDLDATARLLLDITSSSPPSWKGALGPDQLDLAHHHGLLGLLATHPLKGLRIPAQAPYARLHGRQTVMVAHLRRLLERLREADVPASVLKGPHLAEYVYRDSRHRTFTDVDVLVPQSAMPRALEVLATDPAVPSLPRKRPKADKRDIPVRDESGMWFMLDLHWDLFSYTQLLGSSHGATEWAWEQSLGSVDAGFGPAVELPQEAYLAFLCTHALLDHRFRLILFRDLAEMSRRDIDWESLVDFASRWRLRSFTYLALLIAIEAAEARVPGDVLAELRPRSLPLRAVETLLPRIDPVRFDGHHPHLLNLAMVLLHDERRQRVRLLAHAPAAAPPWLRRFGWSPRRRKPGVARRSGTADRVLVLVTSDRRRGAEVFGEQLTGGLLSSGWAAELVSLAGTGLDPRVSADVLARRPDGDLGRLDLGAVLALRRKVQDWKPEVLLANGGATLRHAVAALAAMRNPPLLLYASIGEPEYWIRSPRHRTIQRMLLNRVDLVLAVSEATRAQLIEYVGVPADRVTVAYTGVPDELASIESAPADRSFRVLFLGNLSREKNPAVALHVLQDVRKQANARLRFVGGGPLETELRRLSATMSQNDAVEFVGPVVDVSPHLAWADVLLLPSITEGLPGAVLEAGAASVPTVAYDVGGTGEAIIDGETGILVTAGDVRGLAKQLLLLDADRGLLAEMGAAAHARVVKEFLIEDTVRRYEEILRELVPLREKPISGRPHSNTPR